VDVYLRRACERRRIKSFEAHAIPPRSQQFLSGNTISLVGQTMKFGLAFVAASCAAFLSRAPDAFAENSTPLPKPAAMSSEPESTTATYGDWVLRRERAGVTGQAQRVCEIGQRLEAKGQGVVA
jgi:hypothetical protein